MGGPRMLALSVLAVLSGALWVWSVYKARREARRGGVPVVALSTEQIAYGALLVVAGLVVFPSTAAGWIAACSGCLMGSLLGYRAGRSQVCAFDANFRQEGKITVHVRRGKAFLFAALGALLGFLAVVIVAVRGRGWPQRGTMGAMAAAVFASLGAFFCVSGLCARAWAKRMERQGGAPPRVAHV